MKKSIARKVKKVKPPAVFKWTCVCGNENAIFDKTCYQCEREQQEGAERDELKIVPWWCVCGKTNSGKETMCYGCGRLGSGKAIAKTVDSKPATSLYDQACKLDGIGKPEMETFKSGAKRGALKPPYNLISLELLKRVAKVWGDGLVKYGRNNWKKGGDDFIEDVVNHLIEHAYLFVEGDTKEDHLAHIVCNTQMLVYFEAKFEKGEFVRQQG